MLRLIITNRLGILPSCLKLRINCILFVSAYFISSQILANTSLLTIDASGRDGKPGQPGTDYFGSTAATLSPGLNGGAAGVAEPGIKGGSISVLLDGVAAEGQFVLKGTFKKHEDPQSRAVDATLRIGTSGFIFLNSNGGHGGSGGQGGCGQKGGAGYSGMDATNSSIGTSGGPGYRGGDGGPGTKGASGGDGGEIRIQVPWNQTQLLMLVKTSVQSGNGGPPGKNGCGGEGGDGGRGGSSYSWTTQRKTGQSCSGGDCKMVSNGNGSYRQECTPRVCQDTYTTDYHSNSGGSKGSNGPSGRAANANVSQGSAGQLGKVVFQVTQPNGQILTYSDRYDLALRSYTFRPKQNNGVFEPGDTVYVENLVVQNTGKMPTPPAAEVQISLLSNKWVLSEGLIVRITESLAPGQIHQIQEPLAFKIAANPLVIRDGPFKETAQMTLQSSLKGVPRNFENFKNDKEFQVSFPIEISPISLPKSLAPGAKARVLWRITNVSDKEFGTHSAVRRKILASFAPESNNDIYETGTFNFPQGQLAQDKLMFEIAKLEPKESIIIEGTVSTNRYAPPYSSVGGQMNLEIGEIEHPSHLQLIQKQKFFIRIASHYKSSPANEILFVANHSTTQEEIQAWLELARYFGLKLAIWDIHLNGSLDVLKAITSSSSTLAKDFARKLIVIPNNRLETTSSKNYVTDTAPFANFIKASQDDRTSFYILGGDKSKLKALMLPQLISQTSDHNGNIDPEQLKYLGQPSSSVILSTSNLEHSKISTRDFYGRYDRYTPKKKKWFFSSPDQEDADKLLLEGAREFLQKGQKENPQFIYGSVIENQSIRPDPTDTSRWIAGTVSMRRMSSIDSGSIFAQFPPISSLHSPNFILSRHQAIAFLTALPMELKLRVLKNILSKESILYSATFGQSSQQKLNITEILQALGRAIRAELLFEQRWARQASFALSRNQMRHFMKRTGLLVQLAQDLKSTTSQTKSNLTSPIIHGLAEFISELEFMTWSDRTLFEIFWDHPVTDLSEDATKQLASALEQLMTAQEEKQFRSLISTRLELLKMASRNIYESEEKYSLEDRRQRRYLILTSGAYDSLSSQKFYLENPIQSVREQLASELEHEQNQQQTQEFYNQWKNEQKSTTLGEGARP